MRLDKEVILFIGLGLFLNSYAINWGLPNVNDWTNLSLAPLKPLSYAAHILSREPWPYHYPPLHTILLAIAYSPYVGLLMMSGGLYSPIETYPYGLTNPELSLSVFTLIARFVSVVMGLGISITNYYSIRKFYDKKAALFAGLLLTTSYPIIHYSHNANVDIPQLFWFSLSLYSFVYLIDEGRTKYYMMLGLFAALAFTTKESIYAAFIGMAAVIIWVQFLRGYKSKSSLAYGLKNIIDTRTVYGLIIFGIVSLLIFNPVINWDGLIFHVRRHALRSVHGSWVIRDASSSLNGHVELIFYYVIYIFESSGPLIFVLLMGGLIYCFIKSPRRSLILILPIISYYTFFLRIHGTHQLRYMLPIYLVLFWFAGKLSADLLRSRAVIKFTFLAFILVSLCHSLLYGFSVNTMYVNDPRYHAERWIAKNIKAGSVVLAVEPDYSLPRLPKDLIVVKRDLWDFHGNLIDDIKDIPGDYVILGMSIPRRRERREDIAEFFRNNNFQEIASFQERLPFLVGEIANLHILSPRIIILRNIR
jgi:4-amino-4-deoxy-L-arabinose transferase-like glycosyltransferase